MLSEILIIFVIGLGLTTKADISIEEEYLVYSAFITIETVNGTKTCGASVLNHFMLLTAAHCVTKYRGYDPNITVRVASGCCEGGIEHTVERIILHDDYKYYEHGYHKNDVALLKVKRSIEFSEKVRPVMLARYWPDEGTTWDLVDVKIYRCPEDLHIYSVGKLCVKAKDEAEIVEKTFGNNCSCYSGLSGRALVTKGSISHCTEQVAIITNDQRKSIAKDGIRIYTNVTHYWDWINKNSQTAGSGMENMIYGGTKVGIKDFPHSAYFLSKNEENKYYSCGASILSEYMVLTAASCVRPGTTAVIRVGSDNNNEGGDVYEIQIMRRHESYDAKNKFNDIAIAKVKQPIRFSDKVRPVKIYRHWPKGETAIQTAGWGWGKTEWTSAKSTYLKVARGEISTTEECLTIMDPEWKEIRKGMFCVQHGNKEQIELDPNCYGRPYFAGGDQGDALILRHRRPRNHQVGIVSYRANVSHGITVYTNVTYHYDWIQRTIHELRHIGARSFVVCSQMGYPAQFVLAFDEQQYVLAYCSTTPLFIDKNI